MDFTIFYKKQHDAVVGLAGEQWDVFLAAFNDSDRVLTLFNSVRSPVKHWFVHNEYGFAVKDHPRDAPCFVAMPTERETESLQRLLATLPDLRSVRFCIDISGFMRPHLIALLRLLSLKGIREFDALYAEPARYLRSEDTTFAHGGPSTVRPIEGFAGVHNPTLQQGSDLLVIGVGYEHELVRQVAGNKNHALKLQVLGFPSLRPDFYQENRLNAYRAEESMSADVREPIFAPASDPFVTANVLQEMIEHERSVRQLNSLYLAPLSSRPQTLGFGLYCIYNEPQDNATAIIYPFMPRYSRETASGIARVWQYHIELP